MVILEVLGILIISNPNPKPSNSLNPIWKPTKMKTKSTYYKAIANFEDNFDRLHRRTIKMKAMPNERAKDVYNRLKDNNGVYDIEEFRRLD